MKQLKLFLLSVFFILPVKNFAQSDPVSIFEQVWNSYDTLYSGFIHKDIDWNAIYKIYRPMVNAETSDDELFDVVSQMLRHLHDNHVQIDNDNPKRYFSSGIYGYLVDDMGIDSAMDILFKPLPVSEAYFNKGIYTFQKFSYSWITDSIGYFHFSEFRNMEATREAMDSIIHFFADSKAIIIDVRRNMGGDDKIGRLIAGYFADMKREYMITSEKNGTGHRDFTKDQQWFIEPNNKTHYSKTVILLIDKTSFSAAETFALAMRECPNVKLVGDFTAGAYADANWRTLPCGWNVCIPYGYVRDKNGSCWEGIGVRPDYYIKTDIKAPIQTKDKLIDFSMKLINQL